MLQDRIPYHDNEYRDDNDISDDRSRYIQLERNVARSEVPKKCQRGKILSKTRNRELYTKYRARSRAETLVMNRIVS